jgi:hypothetical protein
MLTPEDENLIARAVAAGVQKALGKWMEWFSIGLGIVGVVFLLIKWFGGQS